MSTRYINVDFKKGPDESLRQKLYQISGIIEVVHLFPDIHDAELSRMYLIHVEDSKLDEVFAILSIFPELDNVEITARRHHGGGI